MSTIRLKFRVNPFREAAEELFPATFEEDTEPMEAFYDELEDFLTDFEETLREMTSLISKSRRFRCVRDQFHDIIIA